MIIHRGPVGTVLNLQRNVENVIVVKSHKRGGIKFLVLEDKWALRKSASRFPGSFEDRMNKLLDGIAAVGGRPAETVRMLRESKNVHKIYYDPWTRAYFGELLYGGPNDSMIWFDPEVFETPEGLEKAYGRRTWSEVSGEPAFVTGTAASALYHELEHARYVDENGHGGMAWDTVMREEIDATCYENAFRSKVGLAPRLGYSGVELPANCVQQLTPKQSLAAEAWHARTNPIHGPGVYSHEAPKPGPSRAPQPRGRGRGSSDSLRTVAGRSPSGDQRSSCCMSGHRT